MATELSPGSIVAGFRIESFVGRGAMAEVYLARGVADGRAVALKLLDSVLARDERFRRRFLRESQLASSVAHPNIVRTVTSGEEGGQLYLAMEYVDGSDLRELLRRDGRIEPGRAVGLVGQVAAALDAAHKVGLVHRDVKPGNILVRSDEQGEHAYVCDFGLARHVSSVGSLTGERGFVGSIDYVPPEQIEGGAVDARADVYSLGCVLFECLAGVRPFDRDSELSIVFAHLNEPPPRITDTSPELPAAFDEVFATALAKSPDDRYSSAGELAAAARAALLGEILKRRRPRRSLVVAIALAAVIAVAAGATYGLTRSTAKLPVTITQTSVEGAKLGESDLDLQAIWGTGYKRAALQEPPGYSELSYGQRNLSGYFIGTTNKVREITTWNKADRTAAGIGPCSSLSELKKAYGSSLKAVPNAIHGTFRWGWRVGHLVFAMGPSPKSDDTVETVGVYSNALGWAYFNAANDGPCAAGAKPVTVAPTLSAAAAKPLKVGHSTPFCPNGFGGACVGRLTAATHTTNELTPKLTYTVPKGWLNYVDQPGTFAMTPSPDWRGVDDNRSDGVSVYTRITAARPGCNHNGPTSIRTPAAIVRWLDANPGLVVSNQHAVAVGVLSGFVVDLTTRPGAAICTDPPPPNYVPVIAGLPPTSTGLYHAVAPGGTMRLYLLAYGNGTLAIEVDEARGDSKLDAYSEIVKTFHFAQN